MVKCVKLSCGNVPNFVQISLTTTLRLETKQLLKASWQNKIILEVLKSFASIDLFIVFLGH